MTKRRFARSTVARVFFALLLSAGVACGADRSGEDWPEFLGPRQDGTSSESNLSFDWPESGPPVLWTRDVGTGYSAPSVVGDRVVLFHRVGREEIVECLSVTDGTTLWKTSRPSGFRDPYGYNNGPRCTPLISGGFVFTFGAEGRLMCVRLGDGSVVWERTTHTEYNVPENFFGVGCTPILDGDVATGRLIVLVGGQPNAAVVAVSPRNGETIWESGGQDTWAGAAASGWRDETYQWTGEEMLVSYSSPVIAEFHGKRHVLALLRQGLVSLDLESGRENFHYWFRSRTHESVNAARPVVVGDTILLSAAYRTGTVRLRVRKTGDGVDELWKTAGDFETHWSTAVYRPGRSGGHFFGFHGRHENEARLVCLEAETGHVAWKTSGWEAPVNGLKRVGERVVNSEGREMAFPYYGRGSAILMGATLLVLGERGTMAAVRATPDGWSEITRCPAPEIEAPSWTAPVLSRGRLFLRDEDSLVALDLRGP